jgi:two-component system, sensor histidine kinase and response regulator
MDQDSHGQVAPADQSAELPTYDDTVLIRMLDGDAQFVSQILDEFAVALRRSIDDIEAAFRAGRANDLVAAAHRLKSSSRTVGAMQLGELCARLESGAKDESPDRVRRLILDVAAEIDAVATCLGAPRAE